MAKLLAASAGSRPGARAGITVDAHRRVLMADAAFFARNPALVQHARRAVDEGAPTLRYYWLSPDRGLLRVSIETSDSERGRVGRLDVVSCEPPWSLTLRELEVLTYVVAGMTNPQIADRLTCTRRTVATHVEHLLAKLGVPSRAAAAALAMAEEALLVPLPDTVTFEATVLGRVTRLGSAEGGVQRDDTDGASGGKGAGGAGRTARGSRVAGSSTTNGRRPLRRAKRAIRLGAVYPVDGFRRLDAVAMRRGAALAVQELNARGGVGGRYVEHIVTEVSGDSDDDLFKAVSHLQAHDVDAITLGNVSPRVHLKAIMQAAEYRAPLMHSMVSPLIAEHVHDNPGVLGQTFQVCATETAYGSGFVRTLDLLTRSGQWRPPNRRLAVVARRSTWDREFTTSLTQLADRHGWTLEAFLPIEDTHVLWDDIIAAIDRIDPAAVFVCTFIEDELKRFLQGARLAGIQSLLYTVWTPTIPRFADRMEGLADGLLWSTVIGTYGDPLSGPFTRGFLDAFGDDPGSGSAAIHYDMVHMLAGAWSALDRPWDFDGVVRHLRQVVHRGVAGPYFFGGRGQRALVYPDDTRDASLAHAHLVHQIDRGRSRVIAPVEIAEAHFRLPGHGEDSVREPRGGSH